MPVSRTDTNFLGGYGEAHALIRAYDWARTAIGAPGSWPPALKALVEVILGSNHPMFVVWGPGRTLIYNEPYIDVLANKHPAFGRDFLDVWSEIRADLATLKGEGIAGALIASSLHDGHLRGNDFEAMEARA